MQTQTDETDFEQYRVPKEEGFGDAMVRHGTRMGSRALETVAGLPGQVQDVQRKALTGAVNQGFNVAEKVSGKQFPNARAGFQKAAELISPKTLPTSQELKKGSQELTGGYTKPQGKGEKFADDVTETIAGLMVPGGPGAALTKGAVARAVATGIAANTLPYATKAFGGGEKAQEYTKLGTLVLAGMIRPGEAQKGVDKMYAMRDKLVPFGEQVNAKFLDSRLANIIKQAESGGEGPGSPKVIAYINTLRKNIKNGKITVKNLTDAKVKINQNRRIFSTNKDDTRLFNEAADAVRDSINSYGLKNPQFLKMHNAADLAHGTIAQGQSVSHFLTDHAAAIPKGYWSKYVFQAGGKGMEAVSAIPVAMYRIMNNPTLRKHYTDVLQNSLRQSVPATANSMKKFEAAMAKEMAKDGDNDFEQYRVR